jgi:hypothetical protein
MAQYLDKFKDIIGKRQGEQILKLLNKKRNSGQIRTIQEFTSQLESLMRELTSTNLIPSLSLFVANENDIIDNDRFNEMLDRVEDDLSASFEETKNIDEVQKSHEALVRDVILKNLRAGVAELESQITLFEFINRDYRGFDTAIFSTFRESKEGRTQRGSEQTKILFSDPRTNLLMPLTQDASVELVGEKLTLAKSSSKFYSIVNARQIFDSESPQSELIVESPTSSLSNLIDNTKGTYWIQTLLFKEQKNFIKTKLEFELGTTREINIIEIEPASKHGLILEAVHYLDSNNIIVNLKIKEREISNAVNIEFKKIATSRIILTFRNNNSTSTQFEYSQTDPLLTQALKEPVANYEGNLLGMNSELSTILSSSKTRDIIGLQTLPQDKFQGYQFTTGFDNIKVGLTIYEPQSIYASSSLDINDLGELGLKSSEARPYIDSVDQELKFTNTTYDIFKNSNLIDDNALAIGSVSNTWFQGSIEYWIVKQDLSEQEALIKTTQFPILPLGTQRIYHERLLLGDDATGNLVFFTNRTNGDIKIYRNGVLQEDNTDDALATTGWQEYPSPNTAGSTPNNKKRMFMGIKVLDSLSSDIFTVSYNPLVSSTNSVPNPLTTFTSIGGLKIVDLVGDLSARLGEGQTIVIDPTGENSEIKKTRLYLMIILRQNTSRTSISPAIEEYTLFAGTKDKNKFEEI